FVERQMAWVRVVLQGIDDEQVEPAELRECRFGKSTDVGTIGQIADTEAERHDLAMELGQRPKDDRAALPVYHDRRVRLDGVALEDRRIGTARRRLKTVPESLQEAFKGLGVGKDVYSPALLDRVGSQ